MTGMHPVLSVVQAQVHEERVLGQDEARVWAAMSEAGRRVGEASLADFGEVGAFPRRGRVLVLAGKGHNAGDALLAAREVLRQQPLAQVAVVFVFGVAALRPLALRAWQLLQQEAAGRVSELTQEQRGSCKAYDLCFDGIFGFRFRPPMEARAAAVLAWSAQLDIRMRVAVDLPSGIGESSVFRADFTYATGILKSPLLCCSAAGRVRYLDLGFFDSCEPDDFQVKDWVMLPDLLDPLRRFRPAGADKRSFGHVFVLGGSRLYPGAILMAVLGALRSGAGLVTAFVPESLVAGFAARVPEAMWVAWPETPDGGLALEGLYLIEHRLARASALVIGPGLGREPETLAMVESLVRLAQVPLVLDAEALQPAIVCAGRAPRILTPHAGEFLRVGGGKGAEDFGVETSSVLVLKGPITRIAWGGHAHHSFCGGPILARGGSGDLLAGLTGGLLAQKPGDLPGAAARAVLWQGLAADLMARERGQVSVLTTDLFEYLPATLRLGSHG